MNACWYIEFSDGERLILSEPLFQVEEQRNFTGRVVVAKERWLKADACRRTYPDVRYCF